MKKLVLVFVLFVVAACSSESKLPNPTGKGTIRAVNAISASPGIEFRIERRALGTMERLDATPSVRYDDLEYDFNFLAFFVGNTETTVIATQTLKVETGADYTFVLSGNVNSPTVTVWQGTERTFDESDTVFETRFAHSASTQGSVDFYVAAEGVAPVLGEQQGTLSFGEILPATDLQQGDYVVTVTTAGDPSDVLFQSATTTFVAQSALIISIFDSDAQNTGKIVTQVIGSLAAAALPDITALPTIRFIQASQDLANADVYDDEMLMNQVLNNHAYLDVSDDIEFPAGTTSFAYTTVGDTSAVLFESGLTALTGIHYNFIVIGREGERFGQTIVPDRQSVSTFAKIRAYHAAFNNPIVDVYIVDSGTLIDEVDATLRRATYSLATPSVPVAAGDYDVYLTVPDEKTILSGPLAVTLALGDIAEIMLYDAVDPAIVDMRIIPPSP
jgi:hypothetical protein